MKRSQRLPHVALHPGLDILSLCTGGGGLDLGIELAVPGARTVCMVEREAFAVAHLVAAMQSGLMAPCPVWSDARTFDGRRWRGCVDGLIGGIPCQPHSLAGRKRSSRDERDLWSPTRRLVAQARPWFVLIENVGGMLSPGDDEVAGAERVWRDLRRLGFAVEAGLFTAAEVGASHERERIFILGVADCDIIGQPCVCEFDRCSQPWREPPSRWRHADGCGSTLAHARRDGCGAGHKRNVGACTESGPAFAAPSSGPLVDTSLDGRREARTESVVWSGRGAIAESSSLFPPGPGDIPGWLDALERRPDLAPVLRNDVADAGSEHGGHRHDGADEDGRLRAQGSKRGRVTVSRSGFRRAQSGFRRVADGVAGRVDRLRMLGNGVVPLQAAHAFRTLATRLAGRGSAGAARLVRMMDDRGSVFE